MLLNRSCAFVDIETTGASYKTGAITEIAVKSYDVDGESSDWQQLVNPGQSIPAFIQRLTGITPAMVADQPYFDEYAAQLYELLTDTVFVAHNARFDYGFLKQAFAAHGYRFQPQVVCTVKLAKALYPQWPKHSLDALCVQMGYVRETSHRAMADVEAMCAFVAFAINDLGLEHVNQVAQLQLGRSATPVHLDPETIAALPNTPGVYHFLGENDALLYVGKSVRMRERVKSHFADDIRSSKELRLSQEVRRIECHDTAGDLGAQLLENRHIKQLTPIYNRKQRAYKKLWSVVLQDHDGLLVPQISNDYIGADEPSRQARYGMYRSRKQVQKWLESLVLEFQLCRKAMGQEAGSAACFAYQLKRCRGVCVGEESVADHNLRLIEALDKQAINPWPFGGPVVFEEPPRRTDNGEALPHLHVVDQWVYIGSASGEAEVTALLAKPADTAFDKETYHILRRFMPLVRELPLS